MCKYYYDDNDENGDDAGNHCHPHDHQLACGRGEHQLGEHQLACGHGGALLPWADLQSARRPCYLRIIIIIILAIIIFISIWGWLVLMVMCDDDDDDDDDEDNYSLPW